MKSTFMRVLGTLALLATIASCGKDGGGSSGARPQPVYIPIGSSTGTSTLANFKTWYKSTLNGSYPGPGLYDEERKTYTYNTAGNCSSQPVKIFGTTIGNIESCSHSGSPTSTNTVSTEKAVLMGGSKASNTILASINAGTAGTLISATQTGGLQIGYGFTQGSLYILRFQATNGSVKEYWIDTGINSAFQPVKTIDVTAGSEEVLTKIQ